ncbi:hypothetical protein BKA70DRAFT_1287162 [Coprinopsis sp. MPI-PUGE-AT-0042]|nr:hypothetical protein BKA70DRAFT_1287162 [Coprinopsis sp. MPI-PUGE-AT-0042]
MDGPAELVHGYIFTGFFFNALLLGIIIVQVYIYYRTYRRDAVWIKVFVGYLFVTDIVNTAFCYAFLHRALISGFGDLEQLATTDWVFAVEPATTAIIGTSVQLFFAWRTRILTQRWNYISMVIVALITLTALTSGVAGIMTAWKVSGHARFSGFQKFRPTVCTWLSATAVCDALITMVLVTALQKQKTGFKRTDLVIDRVIRLTVQTGLLTMVVAILDLAFYLTLTSGVHLLFNYPLSKIYTTSLLSTLTARRVDIHGANLESDEDANYHSTPSKIGGPGFRRENDIVNLACAPRAEVFVQVEEHELSDEIDERSSSNKPYVV